MRIQAGVAPLEGHEHLVHLVLLERVNESGYPALCGVYVALLLGDPAKQNFPICRVCERQLALRNAVLSTEPAT